MVHRIVVQREIAAVDIGGWQRLARRHGGTSRLVGSLRRGIAGSATSHPALSGGGAACRRRNRGVP